jgi:hypothetical protein
MWVRDRVLAWHALGSRFNLQHHKKKEKNHTKVLNSSMKTEK